MVRAGMADPIRTYAKAPVGAVRPELVEACPEFIEGGEWRQQSSVHISERSFA